MQSANVPLFDILGPLSHDGYPRIESHIGRCNGTCWVTYVMCLNRNDAFWLYWLTGERRQYRTYPPKKSNAVMLLLDTTGLRVK